MIHGIPTPELERHLSANPSSPLFALLAERLLRHGEAARAEELCERGLRLYPRYSTARLILARCLVARDRRAEALEELSRVTPLYPGNLALEGLAEEWSDGVAAEEEDLPAEAAAVSVETPPPPMESPTAPPVPVDPLRAFGTDRPSERPAVAHTGFVHGGRIVSRTLAEIYASQGAIGEAVETYRILIERMPGRSAQLGPRLKELEERLRADPAPPPNPEPPAIRRPGIPPPRNDEAPA